MARYLNLTCTNLKGNNHNDIADMLSASARVTSWIATQSGQYLLKCPDDTKCEHIRELADISNNVRVFVSPFEPADYGYSLRRDWCQNADNFLTRAAEDVRQQKEQAEALAAAQDITLTAGFNTKSIHLPNGVRIHLDENGEIALQEKGGAAKKIREKDHIMKNVIK